MVRLAIIADVTASTTTPEPELTVLVQLHQAGGRLRQNALAAAMGWDRTRLSHLLTRMESRRYIERERLTNGVEVSLLGAGEDIIASERPHLEAAVRRNFFDRITDADRTALTRLLDRLLD